MSNRKTLVSEVEDAMRILRRHYPGTDILPWQQLREKLIATAAAMILFIENGDLRAAAEAQAQDRREPEAPPPPAEEGCAASGRREEGLRQV